MGTLSKISGIIGGTFQFGLGGPKLKKRATLLEVLSANDEVLGTLGSTFSTDTISAYTATFLAHKGKVVDGAGAIAHKFGNTNALTTSGAKIASFFSDNLTTEKAYIDKNGLGRFVGGVDSESGVFYKAGVVVLNLAAGGGLAINSALAPEAGGLAICSGAYGDEGGVAIGENSGSQIAFNSSRSISIGYYAGYKSKAPRGLFLGHYQGLYCMRADTIRLGTIAAETPLIHGEADTKNLHIYGNQYITNPNTLGPECLNETDFATHAKWDTTGLCSDTGGYADWTGAGTLTQTIANMAVAPVGGRVYRFVYTASSSASAILTLTTDIADEAVNLPVIAGTHTIFFRTKAVPGNFVISNAAWLTRLDDLSLKEVQGGNLFIGGTSIMAPRAKSGIDQAAAGAVAGELYVDTDTNQVYRGV